MRSRALPLLAILVSIAAASTTAWAQAAPTGETTVKSRVNAVTVYRGQALVTRSVDLPAGAGLAELVVQDLPDHILSGSLFAEGDNAVEIRSVRYRERAVPVDVKEDVRKIDEQLTALNDKIAANAKQMQLLSEERAYLDKLDNFAAPTATVEMTKGVLNAEQLRALTDYQFDKRQKIGEAELKLQTDRRGLQEQADLLNRQRAEIAGRSNKTQREAVVFVDRQRAGGSLKLSYMVSGATWAPSYNARADAEKKSATLEYLASIQQISGEDWTDVKMHLSTASPALVAAAPELRQLNIALAPASMGGNNGALDFNDELRNRDYGSLQKGLTELKNKAEVERNDFGRAAQGAGGMGGGAKAQQFQADANLNGIADQAQFLELITQDSRIDPRTAATAQGVVVTYDLKSNTSLPSRADHQLIQIESLPMKSTFHKVAVPVLTEYIYDQADLVNTTDTVLLEGPVASYVGGQFVGNGAIGTVAVGEPFTLGFGIDSSLRATRTREEKTEQTQGGNRVVSYTYRIALQNFGSKPADVRILDRIPVGNEKEVRITFDEADNVKVSTDKDYLASDHKKGILRWDVTVPAQKTGSDALAIVYKFRLEHDKNLAIQMSTVSQEIRQLLQQ